MNGHDPLCGWGSENHPECFPADMCGNCEMIQRIRQEFISTTNKTWAIQADKAKRELQIVRSQRDLLAERSGLPIPKVNGEEYL